VSVSREKSGTAAALTRGLFFQAKSRRANGLLP
jgi:hypothetical protein